MTVPGGYTIYAEKCPNSRGVRRALQIVAGESGQVLDAEQFIEALAERSSKVDAVLLTGNYADQWVPPALSARPPAAISAGRITMALRLAGSANR